MSFESFSSASYTDSVEATNSLDVSEDCHHFISPPNSPPPQRRLPFVSFDFSTISKALTDWFGFPHSRVVYDSDVDGWDHATFSAIVSTVSHLVVIHFTEANDVFGCTFPTPVPRHELCWLDSSHFIFSLQSNNRLPAPCRWFRRNFDSADPSSQDLATFYDAGPYLYDVSETLYVSTPTSSVPSVVTYVLDTLYGAPNLRTLLFADDGRRIVITRTLCIGTVN